MPTSLIRITVYTLDGRHFDHDWEDIPECAEESMKTFAEIMQALATGSGSITLGNPLAPGQPVTAFNVRNIVQVTHHTIVD